MATNKKKRDPLPDSFPSWREAAEFWDTHDTGDYPEAWKPLNETIEFVEEPGLQINLSPRLTRELQDRARAAKVTVETLVNSLLEKSIRSDAVASPRIAETRATYRKRKAKKR